MSHKRANFGLGLVFSAASAWAHGGSPAIPDHLAVKKRMEKLREEGLGVLFFFHFPLLRISLAP